MSQSGTDDHAQEKIFTRKIYEHYDVLAHLIKSNIHAVFSTDSSVPIIRAQKISSNLSSWEAKYKFVAIENTGLLVMPGYKL